MAQWRKRGGGQLGGLTFIAQRVADYQPPQLPGSAIVHLDLGADGDPADAISLAIALGATEDALQPDKLWRILLDPAGHPFCITTMTSNREPPRK